MGLIAIGDRKRPFMRARGLQYERRGLLAALSGAGLVAACGGGGGASPANPAPAAIPNVPALRTVFTGFRIGAAVTTTELNTPADAALLRTHANVIVSEFEMKPNVTAPSEGQYDFTRADATVNFAQANGMQVRGHTLLWHEDLPTWFYASGTTDQIRQRIETYVTMVVSRYRGRIGAWDVINEPTNEAAGGSAYRNSPLFQAVGPSFMDWAFRAARNADPNCRLYINDFGTEFPQKRARFLTIINDLRQRGVPIDGAGHQFHLKLGGLPDPAEYGRALDATAVLGLENAITELDVSFYADPGSCFATPQTGCLPAIPTPTQAQLSQQARVYRSVLQAAAARSSVRAVTTWSMHDGQTWLNDNPVRGRPDHPLLFDRARTPKTAFFAIADPNYVIP